MFTRRGHRFVPHMADVLLEAWGTTRLACLEEAALGLVELFADIENTENIEGTDRIPVSLRAIDDEDLLVLLLEEVIYVVETLGKVPVRVDLVEHADGRVGGVLATVPAEGLEVVGALPKGVSRFDLLFEQRDRQWRCHVLVDV